MTLLRTAHARGGAGERQSWTPAHVMRAALGLDRWRLAAATALASGHQIGEALVPVVVGIVIDQAIDGGPTSALVAGIGLLAVVFAGLSYSYRYYARLEVRLEEGAAHEMRMHVVRHVLDARGSDHQHSTGALQRLANTDTTAVAGVVGVVPMTAAAISALVVTVVALFNVSTTLGFAVTAATAVTLGVMHLLGKPFEARIHADQERSAEVSGVAADLITGIRVIKGLGADDAAASRYQRISQSSLSASLHAARFEATYAGMASFVTGIFLTFVAFIAGREALQGAISVGALISVVGLAQFLIGPLDRLISSSAALAHCRASARRVAELLSSPVRHTGTASAVDLGDELDIRFEGVSAPALGEVSWEIRPGSMIGLACADPAASAAILDLLAAEEHPADGDAFLSGTSVRELDPAGVRALILAPPHDVDLFDTSLLDNLSVSRPESEVLDRAIAAASVADVIESLPSGIDTNVGERGTSLSGGQRQRVALARALAANPPVLVLHEPTTAVDTATEAAIADGLRELRAQTTTILVTTSPTLLAVCDEVLLLADGQVQARGSHDDLLSDDGISWWCCHDRHEHQASAASRRHQPAVVDNPGSTAAPPPTQGNHRGTRPRAGQRRHRGRSPVAG